MRKSVMPQVSAALLATTAPAGVMCHPRADGVNLEKILKKVNEKLEATNEETKKTYDQMQRDIKSNGQMSEETKQTTDKLLTQQGALTETVNKLTDRLEMSDSQLLELEQKIAAGGAGSDGAPQQSLGQAVVANDDVQNYRGTGAIKIEVNNAITTSSSSGGALSRPMRDPEVVELPRQEVFIRSLLSTLPVSDTSVEYARQVTRTNNAAPTAEEALKPESALAWTLENTPVQTIAHHIPASRQAMDDLPQLQGLIDSELRYGLDLVEDAQLLSGDGVSPNLSGLITNSTAYQGTAEAKLSSVTLIDKLRVAFLEATMNMYPSDGVVLSHEDWMVIETTKDTQGRYIFANPTGIAGPVIWGRRVVPTFAMAVDKFLAGAFRMAATIYDRMETEVLISSEHSDNFVRNMLTVRAEKRLALAVKRPASLIYGDFGLDP